MTVRITKRMVDVGYKALAAAAPQITGWVGEETAAPILAKVFEAMFVAGGYDKYSAPVSGDKPKA